ncbi:type II toxin-antitoxin system prevent-host-death family antitoxin [Phenylobacterium sp. LjRoot219]|uniref:type II toxin-antitoxin system Phd/YefM family antitoxin n=1 Tax=Phenylobacterium sp. LjRoot219 TaxID=3342283 RepID=UPI003ECDF341
METVNIHEAKTNLSKLVNKTVASGESFVIAKDGKPMVKVVPLDQAEKPKRRIGFMKGQFELPDDFNELDQDEIVKLFEGDE